MKHNFLKDKLLPFLKAIEEAEQRGEHAFTCPICGGKAEWFRAVDYNNHLHSHCCGCSFTLVE